MAQVNHTCSAKYTFFPHLGQEGVPAPHRLCGVEVPVKFIPTELPSAVPYISPVVPVEIGNKSLSASKLDLVGEALKGVAVGVCLSPVFCCSRSGEDASFRMAAPL